MTLPTTLYLLSFALTLIVAGFTLSRPNRETAIPPLFWFAIALGGGFFVEYHIAHASSEREVLFWLRIGAFRSAIPAILYWLSATAFGSNVARAKLLPLGLFAGSLIAGMLNLISVGGVSRTALAAGPALLGVYCFGTALPLGLTWSVGLLALSAMSLHRSRLSADKLRIAHPSVLPEVGILVLLAAIIIAETGVLRGSGLWRGTSGWLFIPGCVLFVVGVMRTSKTTALSVVPADALLAAMSDALLIISADRKLIHANNTALKIIGVKTLADIVGKDAAVLLSTDIMEALFPKTGADRVISASTIRDIETTLTSHSGAQIPVSLSASLLRDRRGNVEGVFCICRDITDRRAASEERERLFEELQAALDHVKTLHGLIPICAWCRNVLDDKGYWTKLDAYVSEHSDTEFTHGICPDCYAKFQRGEMEGQTKR